MKRIIRAEIEIHGLDFESYFQGAGVAYTQFESIATGIGNSEREAFEDCLEQMAAEGVDVNTINFSSDDAGILSAFDQITELEDSEAHIYVSVRYTASEAFVLPDCVNSWTAGDARFFVADEGYSYREPLATRIAEDDSVWCDDFKTFDGKIEARKLDEGEVYIDISRLFGFGDYTGDVSTESNFKAFAEEYQDLKGKAWLEVRTDWFQGIYLFASWLMSNPESDLVERVDDCLTNYPLFDEEHEGHLRMEKENEAWKEWARSDFEKECAEYADGWNETKNGDDETFDGEAWLDCAMIEKASYKLGLTPTQAGYSEWYNLREGETPTEQIARAIDSEWFELFRSLCESTNTDWQVDGVNMHIDIKRVCKPYVCQRDNSKRGFWFADFKAAHETFLAEVVNGQARLF